MGSVTLQTKWTLGRLFPFIYDTCSIVVDKLFVTLWKIQEQFLCQDCMDVTGSWLSWSRGCSVNAQQHEEASCQAPPTSSCTPSPPLFLNWSVGPQGSHWLSSLCELHVAFPHLTVPQVSSMQPSVAALVPTPHKTQTLILFTTCTKCVCICLLTPYLTVLQLCWKSNFYVGWILMNLQCWVWKITVLMHESSSVLPL